MISAEVGTHVKTSKHLGRKLVFLHEQYLPPPHSKNMPVGSVGEIKSGFNSPKPPGSIRYAIGVPAGSDMVLLSPESGENQL